MGWPSFLPEGQGLFLVSEIILVLLITIVIAKIVDRILHTSIKKKSKKIGIDDTKFIVLKRLSVFTIYVFGILYAAALVPGFSSLGTSLLASAGILAVVLGFAAQQAFSNVISGIFIAIFEPFKVGDKIAMLDEYGTVEDITLRHTVIKTWQEKRIVIPNAKISEESIINYSLKNERILGHLEVGVSYDSDIDQCRKMMIEEASKHPAVLKEVKGEDNAFLPNDEVILVRLIELTDFAQNLRLYYWAPDKTAAIKIKFDLIESIKKRFDSEGIEIPFPYRTIVYKKDLESA